MTTIMWKKMPVRETFMGVSGGNWLYKPRENSRWYISYQDFSEGGRAELLETLNVMITGDTRRDDETALYDGKVWRILWGDHRQAYDRVVKDGLEACIALYEKLKPKYGSSKWSTDDLKTAKANKLKEKM